MANSSKNYIKAKKAEIWGKCIGEFEDNSDMTNRYHIHLYKKY